MIFIEGNGAKIPAIGLGTWALRGRDCARLVEQAIRIGYRHIDTAQMYDNEREVGEGVRASGLRAEVMVTTKVQPTLLAPRDFERSNSGGERWVCHTLVVMKTSARETREARKPSPTSRSLSYISAVSTWR